MATQPTDLDNRITALTAALVEGLKEIATSTYIQEGLVKEALNSLVWDLYHEFPDLRDMLHDELGSLGMAVQTGMREDGRLAREATAAGA